jgi:hypothetical protein
MIDGNPQPTVGKEIVGVGNWKRAVVDKFHKGNPRDGLTVYTVYLSRRL